MMGGFVFEMGPRITPESLRLKPQVVDEFKAVAGRGACGRPDVFVSRQGRRCGGCAQRPGRFCRPDGQPEWHRLSRQGRVLGQRAGGAGSHHRGKEYRSSSRRAWRSTCRCRWAESIHVTGKGWITSSSCVWSASRASWPGFSYEIGRNQQTAATGGSTALVSLDTFREIANDPVLGKPDPNAGGADALYGDRSRPGAKPEEVGKALRTDLYPQGQDGRFGDGRRHQSVDPGSSSRARSL